MCRPLFGGACAAVLFSLAPAAPLLAADPPRFVHGPVLCATYDGGADDLLTAGLGKTGLQSAVPPAFADPVNPTVAELRRRAIYNNYRALLDMTPGGGYGVLYGPNIDVAGNPTLGEGRIAGEECLTFADDGTAQRNVTMMVQIPAGFDPDHACLVTAPSSGSRGVYGAIGTAGEWGLKHGCAVAYTDKGTGMGTHDLQNDTVNLINGLRAAAGAAGAASNFTARIDPASLVAFNAATPNRFAFKHAHSQQNPENDWGGNVLDSIEFALWLLNERFGSAQAGHRPAIGKANTLVIASSVSNGGGASLLAAESDRHGLIDGVAVAEPQIQPLPLPVLKVLRAGVPVAGRAKGLLDYTTIANLFQPCARLAPSIAASPGLGFVNAALAANRCAALAAEGLIGGATPEQQGEQVLAVLRAAGWEAESDLLHPSHYAFATPAIAVTYANTYGRFGVTDNLCGFSFGATAVTAPPGVGAPVPAAAANVGQIFANGNGIPPTGGINLINNLSLGGPLLDGISLSPNGVQDLNFPGASCLRDLVAGAPTDKSLRVGKGIRQVRAGGLLHGKPAVIVQGRSDALVPVNHASRPYAALNRLVENGRSGLRYYEVTNAQHFDTFIGLTALLPGYDTRFVPLHVYLLQALDLMYAHLRQGTPLPPSQVVRTVPRGGTPGAAPAITAANVPPVSAAPAAADRIEIAPGRIDVPN